MVVALGPGRAAQRSQQPERDIAQLAIVGDEHQEPDAGIGDGGDCQTRQQKDRDRGAAGAAGDGVENDGRRQRARERRQRQQFVLHEAKALAEPAVGEDDRGGGGEGAAGGNADQRRIGERIAEQALHDGAGHREQGADHGRCRDPRNPDRPQHELVARRQRMGRMHRSTSPARQAAGRGEFRRRPSSVR